MVLLIPGPCSCIIPIPTLPLLVEMAPGTSATLRAVAVLGLIILMQQEVGGAVRITIFSPPHGLRETPACMPESHQVSYLALLALAELSFAGVYSLSGTSKFSRYIIDLDCLIRTGNPVSALGLRSRSPDAAGFGQSGGGLMTPPTAPEAQFQQL